MPNTYFFDTYALIEIIKGNENYKYYLNSNILLTKLNLFELYYALLKDFDEKTAEFFINKFEKFTIDFDKVVMSTAAKFKLANRTRNLSMTDCIGYVLAIKYSVKYLTGDKEFQSLPNVEFVK